MAVTDKYGWQWQCNTDRHVASSRWDTNESGDRRFVVAVSQQVDGGQVCEVQFRTQGVGISYLSFSGNVTTTASTTTKTVSPCIW